MNISDAEAFYKESLEYVLTKMDMSDSLWSHVCWVDFSTRKTHLGLMLSILSIVSAQYYSLTSKKC